VRGATPDSNRSIIPVVQPDGSTVFVEQSQMLSSLTLNVAQRLPFTGGELFVSSGLSRIDLFGRQDVRLWQAAPVVVGLRQEIFRPNVLAWEKREQSLRATIAEQTYAEAREGVAVDVAAAFFELYAARLAVANAATNAAVNDTLYVLSKGRYEVGKIGENDLLQSELALLRARASLDDARLEEERALAAFKILLNVPGDASLDIAPPTAVPDVEIDPAVAVAQAVSNRSQLRDFDLQGVQARRRVNEARLSNGFGATLVATAGLNQTAPVFGDAYRSLLDQQRFELAVEMPLFQWGNGRAQVEAARADEERVAATVRASRATFEQDARFAALQFTQSRRQLALSAKADTVAGKRFEVAKNRYVIGKIDIGDLYIAQSEKDAALLAYVQSLRGAWLAYYRLRRLTLYGFVEGRRIEGW